MHIPQLMTSEQILKRNHVNVIGHGQRVILFAHGFGCDQNAWKFLVDAFTADYKVVLFDYTGSGNSDLSQYSKSKYDNLEGYVQDVLDICQALELKDIVFVGHSVSSMVGLLAANRHPQHFSKLIFIGPSPRYLNAENYTGGFEKEDLENLFDFMDSNYLGWSNAMAPAIMGNADRPELGAFLTNSFCATEPEIARTFAKVTFFSDNRNDLIHSQIDSLTLQCVDDIIAPTAVGRYVHEHTPKNTFIQLKATGHCPHISEPEETSAAIKNFLNNS